MVEMVIYIISLVLVVGTVTTILVWMVRASNQVHVRNEVVENVEHALSVMANEIREAQSIYTPAEYPAPPGSPWAQLSLETRNNLPPDETSTYVDFFLCGTRLCVKRESQAPQAVTSNKIEIQTLEFTQVQTGSAPSIHIVVEASYLTASATVQTTASLRAYE